MDGQDHAEQKTAGLHRRRHPLQLVPYRRHQQQSALSRQVLPCKAVFCRGMDLMRLPPVSDA
jgi:hypothetical protein